MGVRKCKVTRRRLACFHKAWGGGVPTALSMLSCIILPRGIGALLWSTVWMDKALRTEVTIERA